MLRSKLSGARELDEVIYQSATTRVFRTGAMGSAAPSGSAATVICKRPLDAQAARRLHHERDILARLSGIEGVVQLAAGEQRQDALVLTDCRGISLAQKLRARRLDTPTALHLARKLAGTLADVHRAGIVHRDIGPSNILVSVDGDPVLIDFDAAAGPPQHPAAIAADLHAFGVTLYQMTTGRLPPSSQEPAEPSRDDERMPAGLFSIILRLLTRVSARRYDGAGAVHDDLQRLGTGAAEGLEGPVELGECD